MQIKAIISFPKLFVAKPAKGSTEPQFGAGFLFPPNDPQIAQIQAEVDAAKANTFPKGFPASAGVCFEAYDTKFAGKEYYDPRFSGWHVLSTTAKQDSRPASVNMAGQPIMDPAKVYSGAVVYAHVGIGGYVKGKGGVGGYLNGVMLTEEEPPMGRLDGKPSVEQMFAGINATNQPAPPSTPVAPPVQQAPVAPAAPVPQAPTPPAPAAPAYVMTEKAAGATREAFKANGWTDAMLVEQGYMTLPGGVTPSFA